MIKNNIYKKPSLTSAHRDAAIIVITIICVFSISYFLNVFKFIIVLFQDNPNTIIWVDEIIVNLLVLSIGSAIFSWRRWRELKKETAKRIKLQEELVVVAETKAQTAEIISKQLRSEIEHSRKDKH
jgi:hypothetical protein